MQVINDLSTIRVIDGPVTRTIVKGNFGIKAQGTKITIFENDRLVFGPIIFSAITNPVVNSAEDARSQIEAFLDTVSVTVAVSSVIPGIGATNLGKAIGAVVGSTDVGVAALVQRDDTLTTLSDPDGDWVTLRVDSIGSQWVRLTDLLSASAETADETKEPLLTNSLFYGFDSEGSTNSKLRSVQVVVDNASASATPNVLITGGIFKNANDTYNDNDAVPDHYDIQGTKHVTAQIPTAEYKSPYDLTAVFTSNVTITLSGLPITITDSSQIAYIRFIPTGGSGARVLDNGINGITITISGSVLTVNGAGTPFASNDVYEVGINGPTKAYDISLDSRKSIEQAPVWQRFTSKEPLISSAFEIGSSFADLGAEIDMQGYNQLALWITLDVGTSLNVQIKLLHKHTSGGAEEFREIFLGSPTANITTINLNNYEIASDTDQLFKFNIPVSATTPFIQIQIKDDADGDGQIDAAAITKAWAS